MYIRRNISQKYPNLGFFLLTPKITSYFTEQTEIIMVSYETKTAKQKGVKVILTTPPKLFGTQAPQNRLELCLPHPLCGSVIIFAWGMQGRKNASLRVQDR